MQKEFKSILKYTRSRAEMNDVDTKKCKNGGGVHGEVYRTTNMKKKQKPGEKYCDRVDTHYYPF